MVERSRRDWRHAAACRRDGTGRTQSMFFPVAERGPARREQEARAKAVCARCPVVDPCRAWALDALPVGVAGGLSETERRAVAAGSPVRVTRRRRTGPVGSRCR